VFVVGCGNGAAKCHSGGEAKTGEMAERLKQKGNNVTNVLALSADGNVLYFGTNGSGVWRRGLEH